MDLYSAFIEVPYTQGAQVRIIQCYLQITHLETNGLLPLLQSAYRSHHSTETALLKVLSDVLTAIDDKKVTLLALLDLSAAFDCVDHKQCDESRIRLNNDSSWSSMAVFLCSVRWCHSRVPNSVD